ncbi:MAG TPA: hypothetical protein VI356_15770 [Myxococcales bacterium]
MLRSWESRRTRTVGSLGGFDIERSYDESFIILFDSRSTRRHHLFPLVRLSHPMRRYDT